MSRRKPLVKDAPVSAESSPSPHLRHLRGEGRGEGRLSDGRHALHTSLASLLLVAPALAVVLGLFAYPLGYSLVSAFTDRAGVLSLANFAKSFDLYTTDMLFTIVITAVSTALVGILAAGIGGYLVLGTHPAAVAILKWLYRWPLFIPFIVAAQCMRTFLAKNGMLNNTLDTLGLVDVAGLSGLLDWRGVIVTVVWKETPFVALLVSGAMAALDRTGIEAARNLGAGGLRILVEVVLPQVAGVMTVGLVLASSLCRCCRCRS